MGLNDNSTKHIANKEIVIPTTIALAHPETQPDKVNCRISTWTKRPLVSRKMILRVKDIVTLEDSNIHNQYDSSITNCYPDFKLNPPYINVKSTVKDISNNLKVYHQNIRGLKGKISQLSNILYSELPHLLCIIEHYLKDLEIDMMSIENCKLGAKFCRHQYKNGGVYIFVHESIDFSSIPTHHISKEKDLEICAIELNLPKIKVVII